MDAFNTFNQIKLQEAHTDPDTHHTKQYQSLVKLMHEMTQRCQMNLLFIHLKFLLFITNNFSLVREMTRRFRCAFNMCANKTNSNEIFVYGIPICLATVAPSFEDGKSLVYDYCKDLLGRRGPLGSVWKEVLYLLDHNMSTDATKLAPQRIEALTELLLFHYQVPDGLLTPISAIIWQFMSDFSAYDDTHYNEMDDTTFLWSMVELGFENDAIEIISKLDCYTAAPARSLAGTSDVWAFGLCDRTREKRQASILYFKGGVTGGFLTPFISALRRDNSFGTPFAIFQQSTPTDEERVMNQCDAMWGDGKELFKSRKQPAVRPSQSPEPIARVVVRASDRKSQQSNVSSRSHIHNTTTRRITPDFRPINVPRVRKTPNPRNQILITELDASMHVEEISKFVGRIGRAEIVDVYKDGKGLGVRVEFAHGGDADYAIRLSHPKIGGQAVFISPVDIRRSRSRLISQTPRPYSRSRSRSASKSYHPRRRASESSLSSSRRSSRRSIGRRSSLGARSRNRDFSPADND